MTKRRILLIGIPFALLTVVGLVVVLTPEREPEYGGKKLSEWVVQIEATGLGGPEREEEAQKAIKRIGTNSIPYLLKWIRYDAPAWRVKLRDSSGSLPSALQRPWLVELSRKEVRALGAADAFRTLGEAAAGCIPELTGMIAHPSSDGSAFRASATLAYLGPGALPALQMALTNRSVTVRLGVMSDLKVIASNALPVLPLLTALLQDTNQTVAGYAAAILGELKLEPDLVIPALTQSLQDSRIKVSQRAALALAEFGDRSTQAIPVLQGWLQSTDIKMRKAATNALGKIDPQALKKPPGP